MMLPEWQEFGVIVVLGWLLGSLGGALSYRIPRELPLGLFRRVRSETPCCQKTIPFYWNVPIFSFLFLKGRCGFCGSKISWHYLWVEVGTLLLFPLTYWVHRQGHIFEPRSWQDLLQLAMTLYFVFSLIVITAVDVEFRIIPDRFSLGNWPMALFVNILLFSHDWWIFLMGGLLGFGLFFALAWFYEKWRGHEGLGMGDVKMMGWLGSWLGFEGIPQLVLLASVLGMLVGVLAMMKSKEGMKTAIPFGPFLALAAYVVWFTQTLRLSD